MSRNRGGAAGTDGRAERAQPRRSGDRTGRTVHRGEPSLGGEDGAKVGHQSDWWPTFASAHESEDPRTFASAGPHRLGGFEPVFAFA